MWSKLFSRGLETTLRDESVWIAHKTPTGLEGKQQQRNGNVGKKYILESIYFLKKYLCSKFKCTKNNEFYLYNNMS